MSPSRDDLELLLPFHVNGTLSAAERAALEAWLAEDATARAEAEGLAAIRRDLQAEAVSSPGDFGLSRLMRAVDAAPAASPGPTAANLNRRPRLWQAVAAVAVAALIGQTALTWRGTGQGGGGFEMAGAADPALAAALRVSFVPTASEAEIRALLLDLGLEIVAGPSALGFYQLGGDDAAGALAALRGASAIVAQADALAE